MSPVYLYALLEEPVAAAMPAGLAGEALRVVPCGGILAVVGDVPAAPEVSGPSLKAHDEAVRRLAAASSALLPARFGSVAEDDRHLCDGLRDRAPALRDALRAVRGCDQMTLRFSRREGTQNAGPADVAAEGGPGTRYLAERQAAVGDPRALPEVRAVLDALAPHVRGERRERHEQPPLVASAYHLVARDGLAAYRAALEAVSRDAILRVTSSGPWPPYAFAPDELG